MIGSRLALLALLGTASAFVPLFSRHISHPTTTSSSSRVAAAAAASTTEGNQNVAQTENTSRERVMTFSYDMSLEPAYEKPTYPGTGNGLSGDSGEEYDVIVIGSGMGGLACGAISAKYGDRVLVLESHIKCGGSAHTFSRMHRGQKYSFEVGPSIFEGLDRPSLNPLRMIFDLLDEQMPVKTYTGLGYWTPTGYWRFPIGSKSKFEDLLMEQSNDGPKAVAVRSCSPSCSLFANMVFSFSSHFSFFFAPPSPLTHTFFLHFPPSLKSTGMERPSQTSQDTRRIHNCRFSFESSTGRWLSRHHGWQSALCGDSSRCLFGPVPDF
jgi:hypothetical protein